MEPRIAKGMLGMHKALGTLVFNGAKLTPHATCYIVHIVLFGEIMFYMIYALYAV